MNTVLLVDDEPDLLKIMKQTLEAEGYQVWLANDGLVAQEFLRSAHGTISAVLVDWSMPHMSGIEFLQWIKSQQEYLHIPVIMQTGHGSPAHIREGIESGAYYYLTKPTHPRILRSILRTAIDEFNAHQSLLSKVTTLDNPFALMAEGTFRFQTLEEAEYLALCIANASPNPESVVGLSELFINAVEHGNLGITYDEKTSFVEKAIWKDEVTKRLSQPSNRNKWVVVRVVKEGHRVSLTIEDEGSGFDFQQFLTIDENRIFDNHGRGIAIARAHLSIHFEGSGNRVQVLVGSPSSGVPNIQ
jgi:DNA-binding response OmpR family regulator